MEEAPIPEQPTIFSAAMAAGNLASDATITETDSDTSTFHKDEHLDDPFAKFSGGFEGTFADTTTFFGVIPLPAPTFVNKFIQRFTGVYCGRWAREVGW